MADIKTTKLVENDKVVVWETVLEPGKVRVCIHTRMTSSFK
jgi:hypothetical protein